MRVGIATDHGGLALKEELLVKLREARHDVVDFDSGRPGRWWRDRVRSHSGDVRADELDAADDYPDIIIPLKRAVAAGKVGRGIVICARGVGASVCANKVTGVRAGLVHDHFSAQQGFRMTT